MKLMGFSVMLDKI